MRCLLSAAFVFLIAGPLLADAPLPSRPLPLVGVIVAGAEPGSFDLIDFRAEAEQTAAPRGEEEPHTMFRIRKHVGVAVGYDNGVVHGSVGFYVTVAEWGRWNFGVPSPALGFGRYRTWDAKRKESFTKEESSIFVSLASVHYRVGYVPSLGLHWYVNFEQIFDMRRNMAGSQVGLSVSR
jgi:hypothetical protein